MFAKISMHYIFSAFTVLIIACTIRCIFYILVVGKAFSYLYREICGKILSLNFISIKIIYFHSSNINEFVS